MRDSNTGKETRRLEGHTDTVNGVAFAADGGRLLSCSVDGTARLWTVATGKEERRLGDPKAKMQVVAFAPDGKTVATGAEGHVCVRDASDGQAIHRWEDAGRGIVALAFSGDGKRLASASRDRQISIRDTASGEVVARPHRHRNHVTGLAFFPDGGGLASASRDSTVCLFSAAGDKEPRQLGGWDGAVRALAIAPDGRVLAWVSNDGAIRLWEVASGQERRVFRSAGGPAHALAFAGDGRRLATAGPAAALIWDLGRPRDEADTSKMDATADGLAALWRSLASEPSSADEASWRLATIPEAALPFLRDRLADRRDFAAPENVARWIKDLDSPRFAARQSATEDLASVGKLAEPALTEALKSGPPLDVRQRVERLLALAAKADGLPPAALRLGRAVETLERIGTGPARQALKELADGPKDLRIVRDAHQSWKRAEGRAAN